MGRPLTSLLLDCDGVIVNSESVGRHAEMEALRDLGLSLSVAEYQEITLGLSEEDHLRRVQQRVDELDISMSGSELGEHLRHARWSSYGADLELVPGMLELIDHHRDNLAVVSSSAQSSVWRKLQLAGVRTIPEDRIFTAEHAGDSKEKAYRQALACLGTSADRCLAIEDSEPGVLAARRAHLEVWGFTGDNPPDERGDAGLIATGASKVFHDARVMHGAIDEAFKVR